MSTDQDTTTTVDPRDAASAFVGLHHRSHVFEADDPALLRKDDVGDLLPRLELVDRADEIERPGVLQMSAGHVDVLFGQTIDDLREGHGDGGQLGLVDLHDDLLFQAP